MGISGAIAGGLCSWLSGAGEIALSIPKQMLVGGFGDVGLAPLLMILVILL